MDIRGLEVTNQLRSAIRAKLLELGVRYDEELPDYILVMIVNKKSRQQMQEDLYLFLEDSTIPFVDWLHDQVLKKLQKVTVAKKKSCREFVPTVVVKQEEEKKKRKNSTTSFLEDQTKEQVSSDKLSNKTTKEEKSHKQLAKSSSSSQNTEANHNKISEKSIKALSNESKTNENILVPANHQDATPKKDQQSVTQENNTTSRGVKRPIEALSDNSPEKKNDTREPRSSDENDDGPTDDKVKRLKSCVNKPKITSVVSVKNRLGTITSPRKKFETYRENAEVEGRHKQVDKYLDKKKSEDNHNSGFQRYKSLEMEEKLKRNRDSDIKQQEIEKTSDIKSRLGTARDRLNKISDVKDKGSSNLKLKAVEKLSGSVKDRLGINNNRSQKLPTEIECKNIKGTKNIKTRLGPLKSSLNISVNSQNKVEEDRVKSNIEEEREEEEEEESDNESNSGPVKSHIIAVRKEVKSSEKLNKKAFSDEPDEEEIKDTKLPSKVIVTPRPLKPLQPLQKRATQSLLLRAVAEANQSVVKQKNPEPCLLEKKPALKRLRMEQDNCKRELGQNLSVRFNASKRLVMENIQVELNTAESTTTESPKTRVPLDHVDTSHVTDDHMGVVLSLFQKSDNSQKFLVTLNGYNNNLVKKKTVSNDEESFEVEVNEEDELALLSEQSDLSRQNNLLESSIQINEEDEDLDQMTKEANEENNENCNIENMDMVEHTPIKRRKLSPIIYNRSRSPSPSKLKSPIVYTATPSTKLLGKKASLDSGVSATVTVLEKSKEKCRYWPNCTLGKKCAFVHPAVMCSAFPNCKFGEKCAYQHPKCKFGLSCTKLGCAFSHPAKQCKYHPFCNKPGCLYSHPASHTALSVEATSQRAKFTWRRRD